MDISPPEPLNFAQHLFQINSGRAHKAAYADDSGTLTYGELADRSRRFAAALLDLGVRREERVLLLMLDANEWPVAFLGSLSDESASPEVPERVPSGLPVLGLETTP